MPGPSTEEELRSALDIARARYEAASREFNRLTTFAHEIGLDRVDGAHSMETATRTFNAALKEYNAALDRFAHFLLHRPRSNGTE